MKVNIDYDEWYPVYYFYKEGDRWFAKGHKVFDIPPVKVVELEEIFRKFDEAQKYLTKVYERENKDEKKEI